MTSTRAARLSGIGNLALVVLSTLLAAATTGTPVRAQEAASDFPLVVKCSLQGDERYFYLSRVRSKDVAVYVSPDNLAAVITATGTPIKVMTQGAGSCADKTISELRESGQAFDPVKR